MVSAKVTFFIQNICQGFLTKMLVKLKLVAGPLTGSGILQISLSPLDNILRFLTKILFKFFFEDL